MSTTAKTWLERIHALPLQRKLRILWRPRALHHDGRLALRPARPS
jgi:hypothetical protein